MREIKFRAWHKTEKSMLQAGDDYGSKHSLDCVVYFMQGQPVELMQYTGLKDKQGKEIYEGDILKLVYSLDMGQWTKYGETTIQVKWSDFQCGFYPFVNFKDIERTEVIGNIYENPEILPPILGTIVEHLTTSHNS